MADLRAFLAGLQCCQRVMAGRHDEGPFLLLLQRLCPVWSVPRASFPEVSGPREEAAGSPDGAGPRPERAALSWAPRPVCPPCLRPQPTGDAPRSSA